MAWLVQIFTQLRRLFERMFGAPAILRPVVRPIVTDGSSLERFRAKAGRSVQRILYMGDSWSEQTRISKPLRSMLTDAYGQSGYGWISCDGVESLPGLKYELSGWSLYDATTNGAPQPDIGSAIDGKAIFTDGQSAIVNLSVEFDRLKIWYRDTLGSFRYKIDGGEWIAVKGSGTGEKRFSDLMVTDGVHDVRIDTLGNEGLVVLYGFHASCSKAGIEFNKCGNGGLDAGQLATYEPQCGQFIADIRPDVFMIILGTNDYRRQVPFSTFTNGLLGLARTARAANPDVAVILIAPAQTGGVPVQPLLRYVDEMHRISAVLKTEFFSIYDLIGDYAAARTPERNLFADPLHLNDAGGEFVARYAVEHLFK